MTIHVTAPRRDFTRERQRAESFRAETCAVLQRAGFAFRSQRGSHRKLRHPDGRSVIAPMHRELATGTLRSILRQAQLSPADFEALRR